MEPVKENLVEVVDYRQLGELPNPFVFDEGTPLKSKEEWEKRRAEIYKTAIELQYGGMPPEPEFLKVEPIYPAGQMCKNVYRITTGRRECPVSFRMTMYKAKKYGAPVVISGDDCFSYMNDKDIRSKFLEENINLVCFDRTELAHDIAFYNVAGMKSKCPTEYALLEDSFERILKGEPVGQLKDCYTDSTFGAIAAWAWGYSRCVDALEKIGYTNNLIAFTGHSRGGKTCALAGAVDSRAKIVNPNATCCGAYSAYRINTTIKDENGEIKDNEDLAHIFRTFPAWLGSGMKEYIGREQDLPFDAHYLKALVAPRVLLVTEAASDVMANPVGSYQTTLAAGEVYKFLGCKQNLVWHFRKGTHNHASEDMDALIDVIKMVRDGTSLPDNFYKRPFSEPPKAYNWSAPTE